MNSFKKDSSKAARSSFADFIRNAKSNHKKRVYSEVLTEATKQQNRVMLEAQTKDWTLSDPSLAQCFT